MQMTLTVGAKVFYPGRGPCLVDSIIEKVVCGLSARFYRLILLDDSRAELFVPVDNSSELSLRGLLGQSEIPKLLDHLRTCAGAPKDAPTSKNWRQRELERLKLFRSDSIFDLADVVETLTQLGNIKTLAMDERETLLRARKLLICEISEVMNESKSAAEARMDNALNPA
jgi:RNA polymerase-interacting CarD/CdnL/TRCF family regulator